MTQPYRSLREKIAAQAAERSHRYAKFRELWDKAHAAGIAAGNAAQCAPMIVTDGNGRQYPPVMDGVCGFAWVVHYPGNSSFATWAKKNKGARKEYGGGVCLRWVGEFNQSMTRKEAYARAFAEVLRGAGVDAHSMSRMD